MFVKRFGPSASSTEITLAIERCKRLSMSRLVNVSAGMLFLNCHMGFRVAGRSSRCSQPRGALTFSTSQTSCCLILELLLRFGLAHQHAVGFVTIRIIAMPRWKTTSRASGTAEECGIPRARWTACVARRNCPLEKRTNSPRSILVAAYRNTIYHADIAQQPPLLVGYDSSIALDVVLLHCSSPKRSSIQANPMRSCSSRSRAPSLL